MDFPQLPPLPELPMVPAAASDPLSLVLLVALGLVLLTAGRRLFWLAVGALGFLAGLYLSTFLPAEGPPWMRLVVALGCGVAGIILTFLVKKVALGIAGFLVGGFAAVWVSALLALEVGQWYWVVFALGGLVGAALAAWIFDLALVVVSSAVGAALLLEVFSLSGPVEALLFAVLTFLGIVAQTRTPSRVPRSRRD